MRSLPLILLMLALKFVSAQISVCPVLNPFVNEACETNNANLTGIWIDGTLHYWPSIPDYTEDPGDVDKNRFTWVIEYYNQYTLQFERMWNSGYLLPMSDYGGSVCEGIQEFRIWVLDELTGIWYYNSQVIQAAFLCGGQSDCDFGYSVFDIEYGDYTINYQVSTGYW